VAELRFTWDPDKARTNERKHGVTFEEAQSIFYDQYALQLEDPDEAAEEERFVMLGLSSALRMLTVAHCVRASGDEIRIISARKAGKAEQRQYWERLRR
jgi:uncharacterized DUF497 family protein